MNDIIEWWNNGKISDLPDLVKEKIKKTLDEYSEGESTVINVPTVQFIDVPNTYYTSDTIPSKRHPGRYTLAGSINLNQERFGIHNALRNNIPQYNMDGTVYTGNKENKAYEQVKSPGMVITTFSNWVPYSKAKLIPKNRRPYNDVLGVDITGKIKLDNFEDSDFVSFIPSLDNVAGFKKDSSGKISWNGYPLIETTDGKLTNRFHLSGKRENKNTGYDDISGGGIIVQCEDELRALLGPLNYIDAEIQNMKRRHNTDHVKLYFMDPGSFNNGLRTYSGIITPKDWEEYNKQNVSGGHGLYILPLETIEQLDNNKKVIDENVQNRLSWEKWYEANAKMHNRNLYGPNYKEPSHIDINDHRYTINMNHRYIDIPDILIMNPTIPGILHDPNFDLQPYVLYTANQNLTLNSGQKVSKGSQYRARSNGDGTYRYDVITKEQQDLQKFYKNHGHPIKKFENKTQIKDKTKKLDNFHQSNQNLNFRLNDEYRTLKQIRQNAERRKH